jgi:hypothetical protein
VIRRNTELERRHRGKMNKFGVSIRIKFYSNIIDGSSVSIHHFYGPHVFKICTCRYGSKNLYKDKISFGVYSRSRN